MKGLLIADIKIGDTANFQKTITETDVYLYAGITGDNNPAHINAVEAEKGRFKERIAHGMLVAGLVSAVLGVKLPGPGTIYLGQEMKFTAPVKFGDTVDAVVEVIEKEEEKNIIRLKTVCTNQDGTVVLDGIATVMPPK